MEDWHPFAPSAAIQTPLTNSLKEGLLSTAEEVPGRQRKKIQSWVTNQVPDRCYQRRQLKQKYKSTEALLAFKKSEPRSQEEDEGSKE